MNVGFEGFGVNESLSETYRQRVEQTVSNAYTYSFSVDYTTECTVKKGTEGVGLFQQVIYSNDGKLQTYGVETLCRYGALWKTVPDCPYDACADPECLSCIDGWKN